MPDTGAGMLPPASPTLSKRSGSSSMPGTNAASRSTGPRHQNRSSPSHALNHFANATLAARKLAHPQSQHAWRAQTEAGMLFNPLGRQRRITQPTLVVQGTADQVVDPGNAEVLAGLVPDVRLQRFDGAGHLLYWEQPKRFVRVVTDFLTDPGSAARVPATPAHRAS